ASRGGQLLRRDALDRRFRCGHRHVPVDQPADVPADRRADAPPAAVKVRGALAAALAVAIAAGAAPAAGAAAKLPPGAAPYGLIASNANFVPGKTIAERSANYRRLYRAGVRAIRLDVNWVQVEPVGKPLHDHDFRERDREVAAITRA